MGNDNGKHDDLALRPMMTAHGARARAGLAYHVVQVGARGKISALGVREPEQTALVSR